MLKPSCNLVHTSQACDKLFSPQKTVPTLNLSWWITTFGALKVTIEELTLAWILCCCRNQYFRNPFHFDQNRTWLAVLFSRQIRNGFQDFFPFAFNEKKRSYATKFFARAFSRLISDGIGISTNRHHVNETLFSSNQKTNVYFSYIKIKTRGSKNNMKVDDFGLFHLHSR